MRGGGGEIVEVQGGHIVRSTGRKDRHSKVCTSKGPRDRRVRLSAHTAIQFYDVQDRLGYDRPSKAVDWLIKNAKSAIDELAELPAWQPTAIPASSSGKRPMQSVESVSSSAFSFATSSSFIPPSLDSDAIADTIKSFFPVTVAATSSTSSSPSRFHDYSPELLPQGNQSQDLRLSLQSFQDPTFPQPSSVQNHSSPAQFSFHAASAGFSPPEPRMATWNSLADGGGGYVFNLPPSAMLQPMVFGQGQLSSQRGPLQSSNSPLVRPWTEPADHQLQQTLKPPTSSIGFASSGGNFSGFRIPARIQGEDEPSSGFSASHRQCPR
ncbi:hypothetical protein HPP92_020028 [Vanilla planifolia]|uniref:TCP domain-containing protein n=1 Tax=Vanilla planifolia TaxID=51239 RepID=A0A835UI36_VANPL|nr:hypothetical protein HPP92_020028 [Vanilla planifolia]